jgi:spermidine synthase
VSMVPTTRQSTLPAKLALPVLLLLSGFCGISYEILYSKLLGNMLGSQFTINATVLLTFLLGIGIGTLYAHRFVRYLWLIEAGIGVYAVFMAISYDWIGRLLFIYIPIMGTNVYAAALVSLVLLAVPAFLIGCSIPLFANYLSGLRETGVFSVTYGIYNLGAAITALFLEFIMLRSLGLRKVTILLALLNGVVALGIWLLARSGRIEPARPQARRTFSTRVLAALALASVASAIFQLSMIKIAEFIFGPFNETFALVLATVLIGLAIGSALTARCGLTFNGALLLSLVGLAGLLMSLPSAVEFYATCYPAATQSYPLLVMLKFGLVFALMCLPAIGFGATIPALLKTHQDVARESGQLLFVSSVANALGFVLMAFVLHAFLDYGPLLLLIAALTAGALLLKAGMKRVTAWAACVLVLLAALGNATLWDETLLYLGHTSFHTVSDLKEEQRNRVIADRFKGPRDVFAIIWKDDVPFFFINGYISIALTGVGASEKVVGALATSFAPRTDTALVIGMGSGSTAGVVGLFFDRTDVVEINRVVLDNLDRMAEYNFDIEKNSHVQIIHDDGIHFIKTTDKTYSLILNTVTTPLYFSSSKLYTRDFFALVRERLAPGGVYTTWVDGRIGEKGVNIILETLSREFSECWLTYLTSNYFMLACSNDDIGIRQMDALEQNAQLRQQLDDDLSIPARLLRYATISTDAFGLRAGEEIPVNTQDFPVLEFEMARLPGGSGLVKLKGRLRSQLDLYDMQQRINEHANWDPTEFAVFADLRLGQDTMLLRVLYNSYQWQFMSQTGNYGKTALALAEQIGTADAFYVYGEMLMRRGFYTEAIDAFTRVSDINPSRTGAHLNLGRCHHEQGDHAAALLAFIAEWDLSRDAAATTAMCMTLNQLERYPEAIDWLDAGLIERPVEDEEALICRGQALEGVR